MVSREPEERSWTVCAWTLEHTGPRAGRFSQGSKLGPGSKDKGGAGGRVSTCSRFGEFPTQFPFGSTVAPSWVRSSCLLSLRPSNRWQGVYFIRIKEEKKPIYLFRDSSGTDRMVRPGERRGCKIPEAIVFWIHKVTLYSTITPTADKPCQRSAVWFLH